MKTKDSVQTIILICGISAILIFFLTYQLLLVDTKGHTFKDSLSITGSFFGGIATLAAAYIATLLFNDWKEPYHQEKLDECIENIYKVSSDLLNYHTSAYLKKIGNINCLILEKSVLISDNNQTEVDNFYDEISSQIQEVTIEINLTSQKLFHLNSIFTKYTFKDHEIALLTKDLLINLNHTTERYINYQRKLLEEKKKNLLFEYVISQENLNFWAESFNNNGSSMVKIILLMEKIREVDTVELIKHFISK